MKSDNKIMVLGLDGSTFRIIDYLVSKGKMPTFEKIIERGFATRLKSCVHPVTFPAWKCLTTGLSPGKLGVYSFYTWDKRENKIKFVSSQDFNGKDVWDYLGTHGYRVAAVNVPGTFPPKKVNGFMISGHFAFDAKNYTYPRHLKKLLQRRFNYEVESIQDFRNTNERELTRHAIGIAKTRFQVTEYLISEMAVDFIFTVVFLTDNFEHYFWHKLRYDGNPIEEFYHSLDEELKKLLVFLKDNNFDLIIVSDHGMCGKKMTFELNTWFYLNKYLHFERNPFRQNLKARILNNTIPYIMKIGLHRKMIQNVIKFFSPKEIYKIASHLQLRRELFDISIFDYVDWERSIAFSLGSSIYVVQKDPEIAKRIAQELTEITNPKTGEKICEKVLLKEEAYGRNCHGNPPEITLLLNVGYGANSKISEDLNPYDFSTTGWGAIHDYDGIFIAYGPRIRGGISDPSTAFNIFDVTPTILEMYGLSSNSFDGKSRASIIRSNQKARI